MMIKKIFVLIIFSASVAAVFSQPADIRIQGISSAVSLPFSMDSETSSVITFTIRDQRTTGSDFFVTFSPGSSGIRNRVLKNAANVLPYNIVKDTVSRIELLDLSLNPSENEVITGSFSNPDSPRTIAYSVPVLLPPGGFGPALLFSDNITVSVYKGTLQSFEFMESKAVTISTTVPQLIDFSIVAPGSSFEFGSRDNTLNFGVMHIGLKRNTDLVVRANTVFAVSLSSLNSGVMRNTDISDDSAVPYSFVFNSVLLQLDVPRTPVSAAGPTAYSGLRYPIELTIGDFGMATEGTYRDVITITVSAN
jgi:hypothetical protein